MGLNNIQRIVVLSVDNKALKYVKKLDRPTKEAISDAIDKLPEGKSVERLSGAFYLFRLKDS